jgi:hypothetical protein
LCARTRSRTSSCLIRASRVGAFRRAAGPSPSPCPSTDADPAAGTWAGSAAGNRTSVVSVASGALHGAAQSQERVGEGNKTPQSAHPRQRSATQGRSPHPSVSIASRSPSSMRSTMAASAASEDTWGTRRAGGGGCRRWEEDPRSPTIRVLGGVQSDTQDTDTDSGVGVSGAGGLSRMVGGGHTRTGARYSGSTAASVTERPRPAQ